MGVGGRGRRWRTSWSIKLIESISVATMRIIVAYVIELPKSLLRQEINAMQRRDLIVIAQTKYGDWRDKCMEQRWRKQLEIAVRNSINNEIITPSGDGVVKPSQYVDNCVSSIMEQVSIDVSNLETALIRLTDVMGYNRDEVVPAEELAYQKCFEHLCNYAVEVEHKWC